MSSPPLFSEVQRFRDLWWWKLLIVVGGVALVIPGAIAVAQYFSQPANVCRGPVPPGAFLSALIGLLVGAASVYVLITMRLETSVTPSGVHVRFRPFHLRAKFFPFGEITSAEPVTYRPLVDYGGWGIRYGKKGWAYNVSGNRGVMLTFRDRGNLMIGSGKADEFSSVVSGRLAGHGKA